MHMPGYTAERALRSRCRYAATTNTYSDPNAVVPAIPPCHACDDILELCFRGEARGAVCRMCATGRCDPEDWRNPPPPFPRNEPWNPPF